MDSASESMERSEVPAEDSVSKELVERIKKLRWMGMDEEAERLQVMLRDVHQADILTSGPGDTD